MLLHNFSHFLQIWVFPPGLILLWMAVGYFCYSRGYRWGKKLMLGAYGLFWLLSSPLCAQALVDGLQKNYPPLSATALGKTANSSIVILGSGIEAAPEYPTKAMLSDMTLKRVHYGAYLYRQTQAAIITSGGNRDYFGHAEADLMQIELQNSYTIPTVARENTSRTTQEQSTLLIPILKANDIHRIYLVTHAWHMSRAVFIFTRSLAKIHLDITIIPAPMGYIALKSENVFINMLPSLNALNASALALHEYIGLVWYHFL